MEEGEVKRVWPPAKNTLSRAIIHVASKMAQPRLCVVKKRNQAFMFFFTQELNLMIAFCCNDEDKPDENESKEADEDAV